MRHYALFAAIVAIAVPSVTSAQELSASDRDAAVARVRSLASCVERQHQELARILTLIRESETQRDRARDPVVRRDAERAIEALIARAATAQSATRSCLGGDLPSPGARVVERDPPADPAAESVAESGGTVLVVERDADLTSGVRVVRGEQVDGTGRLEVSVVRSAVRGIGRELQRCYDSYLERASAGARELDLVFAFRGSPRASDVDIERSGFSDARFEQCVRTAGRGLRASQPPSGGEAIYSYRLRFGR